MLSKENLSATSNVSKVIITGTSVGGLGGEAIANIANHSPSHIIYLDRSQSKSVLSKGGFKQVKLDFVHIDLSDLESVRKAATEVRSLTDHVDVLINNSGIMGVPFSKSPQGVEKHLAVNYLGHFLLTNLIVDKIASGGRIVNLSSVGHELSPVLEDPNFDDGKTYSPWKAYGQSKTAMIVFTTALKPRLEKRNISVFALHPGTIKTPIESHVTKEMWEGMGKLWEETHGAGTSLGEARKSVPEGAATTVYAAFDPSLKGKSGAYLADCDLHECRSYANDPKEAERLWALSEKIAGEEFMR